VCSTAGTPVSRRRAHIELTIPDTEASSRVEIALQLMTGAPRDLVRAVVDKLQFGVMTDAAPEELERLFAALSNIGVRFRQSTVNVTPGQHTVRFAFDARFAVQLLAVFAVAVGAVFLGAPVVGWLGVPVAMVVCWGSVERVPQALELVTGFADQSLGAVDRAVWNELGAQRRSIRSVQGQAAADRCLVALCGVIDQIRGGGWHLTRQDFSSLDQDAHTLLRRSFRLAAAADRVAQACEQPGLPTQRATRLVTARREMFAALSAIEHKLEALRHSLIELSGIEASNEELIAATTRVTEIQVAVETGLELSALAGDEPNRESRRPATNARE
jgi:hypothetical protein